MIAISKNIFFFLTICVSLFFSSLNAKDTLRVKFGDSSVLLPNPDGLCSMGKSSEEKLLWKWMEDAQIKSGGKLLGMWIDCDFKNSLISQSESKTNVKMDKWVIVIGLLNEGKEDTFKINPKEYNDYISGGLDDPDIQEVTKRVDKTLREANLDHFDEENFVRIKDPIYLGVLAITDAVHLGVIMEVASENDSALVSGILGNILINDIPIGFNFYGQYQNKQSVAKLLSESKKYSAKLLYSN